jgi:malate dehydrogenase (oxaloacetate-decarboxylating)
MQQSRYGTGSTPCCQPLTNNSRCVDKPGLLVQSHGDKLTQAQIPYARVDSEWDGKDHSDILSVIKEVKPHVLIGTSTKPKAFTKEIVQEMASHVERPIIFPLSNPTRLHEADPKDISEWTKGKALIATGSPFPPVTYDGNEYEIAECNNSTCFPGIGLGCVLSRSRLLSDKMLMAAVKALAAQSPALKDPEKGLLPDVVNVREISVHIACAVVRQAVEEGLSTVDDIPGDEEQLQEWVREQMWAARYRPLRAVSKEKTSRYAKGEIVGRE